MSGPEPSLFIERVCAPIASADRDAIIALEAGSFSNPWTADTFDVMLATPVSHVYVARLDLSVVAFCACWVIEGDLHINTLAVNAGVRRRGIGSRLLTEVLSRTAAHRSTLEVRRSNTAALGLYQALGFRVTAVRPQYYAHPEEDALILWLNP